MYVYVYTVGPVQCKLNRSCTYLVCIHCWTSSVQIELSCIHMYLPFSVHCIYIHYTYHLKIHVHVHVYVYHRLYMFVQVCTCTCIYRLYVHVLEFHCLLEFGKQEPRSPEGIISTNVVMGAEIPLPCSILSYSLS